ncbi:MAG: aldose 1-epimerase [Alphaproteobacteria bacterium]
MALVTIEDGSLRASVLPEAGASLVSLEARISGEWTPVMRPTPPDAIASRNSSGFASFALVPWSNRVRDARFEFEGREIRLRPNTPDGHAIHGDVRKRPWTAIAPDPARPGEVAFAFESSEAADVNFPFRFASGLAYRLHEGGLEMRLSVTNRDAAPMPAGLGFHPYFRRSIAPGEEPRLRFAATGVWREMLPREAAGPLAPGFDFSRTRAFGTDTFDNCFDGWAGEATIEWPASRVTATLSATEPFRHLVLYVPPGEPFFAVEPVSNANDGFNLFARGIAGSGVRMVAPGETLEGTVRIAVTTPG